MSLKLSKKAFIFVIVFVINILLTVKLWTDQASFALLAVIVGVTFLLLWSLRENEKTEHNLQWFGVVLAIIFVIITLFGKIFDEPSAGLLITLGIMTGFLVLSVRIQDLDFSKESRNPQSINARNPRD